jgi:hypothetical protein
MTTKVNLFWYSGTKAFGGSWQPGSLSLCLHNKESRGKPRARSLVKKTVKEITTNR